MNTKRYRFGLRRFSAGMRSLPDFLIIGAQKCGTTSLYAQLCEHPKIGSAFEKEVRYFNNHYEKGLNWYKAHFPLRVTKRLVGWKDGIGLKSGEGEPSYLPNPVVPQRVFDLIPNVRLIVMLRNPVDRAYSHFQHRSRRGREPLSFEQVVAADKERLRNGWSNLPTADNKRLGNLHYSYLPRGIYVDQIRSWMSIFPREQFLIIRAEDFFSDAQTIYDDVLDFLRLPGHRLRQTRRRNVGSYTDKMSDEVRMELVNYFRPHNSRLYEYLDRDFLWDS